MLGSSVLSGPLSVAVPLTFIVAIVLMVVEALVFVRTKARYNQAELNLSLLSGLLTFGLTFVANRVYLFSVMKSGFSHKVVDLGIGPWAWLLCFLVYDFSFYVGHRAGHEVRLFWCVHQAHHTPHDMRLATAIRGSMFSFLYLPWFFVWIPLLGFDPAMVLIVESFSRTWGVLTHLSPDLAPSRWFTGRFRWLHWVFISPSSHRVHHATQEAYLDRNYGEVLTIWDHLFGTYIDETETPTYGVLAPCDSTSFWDVQIAPWVSLVRDAVRAPNVRSKLRYLLDAPGWAHDGADHRVRYRRALEGAEHGTQRASRST